MREACRHGAFAKLGQRHGVGSWDNQKAPRTHDTSMGRGSLSLWTKIHLGHNTDPQPVL